MGSIVIHGGMARRAEYLGFGHDSELSKGNTSRRKIYRVV